MKRLAIALFCLAMCYQVKGQKNSVEIGAGNYKIYNVIFQLYDTPGMVYFSYRRSINDRVSIRGTYSRLPIKGYVLAQENIGLAKESVGKLTARHKHNYFDLGVQYAACKYHRHTLSAIAAFSLATGSNEYLRSVVWTNPEPGQPYGHPIDAQYEYVNKIYLGGLLSVRYDYRFLKNRINAGGQFTARYYNDNFPFQINYGVHLGYNF